jgi:hypothetical protein
VWVKWKLLSVRLDIVLISMQDWCTVCTERAMGSEIILGTPDGAPRYVCLVEGRFNSFRDSVNGNLDTDGCTVCIEHAVGSKIVMRAPNGTPR